MAAENVVTGWFCLFEKETKRLLKGLRVLGKDIGECEDGLQEKNACLSGKGEIIILTLYLMVT